jgi:hypothetical protein
VFDLFFFQALAAKESRMRGPTRKSMDGEQGKNFFPCCDQQRKQEIELIKLVNARGGGGRELYVGYYRRAD